MGLNRSIALGIVVLFFLIAGGSFARSIMSTVSEGYRWLGVFFWFGILLGLWILMFFWLVRRKNKETMFYEFSFQRVEFFPARAGEALYFSCLISLLVYSVILTLIGAALFDKFVAFEILKWVVDLLKWFFEKGWAAVQKVWSYF